MRVSTGIHSPTVRLAAVALVAALLPFSHLGLVGDSVPGGSHGERDAAASSDVARGSEPPDDAVVAAEVEQLRAQRVELAPSAEVGTLPGSSRVDFAGQAHYSMPVDVAAGVGGMTPSLSLNYTSGHGNGPVGVGFALGGLSAIRRCPGTIAFDGAHEPVRFSDADSLCLGGNRLVLVAGGHGADGAEYRTRSEPFDKVVLHGQINDRGGFFEVFTRDGRILTYGTPAAILFRHIPQIAGQPDPVQTVPYHWALLRQADRFGNSIDYHYASQFASDGSTSAPVDVRLTAITYAGSDDSDPARVRFLYEDRPDVVKGFFFGAAYETTGRVARIVVDGVGGQVLHEYRLAYDQHPATGQSNLVSVTKCDAAGACLPSTTFRWETRADGFKTAHASPELIGLWADTIGELDVDMSQVVTAAKHAIVGDFRGDGDQEVLFHIPDVNGHPMWLAWDSKDAAPGQFFAPFNDATLPPQADEPAGDDGSLRYQPPLQLSAIRFNANDVNDDLLVPQRDSPDSVDAWGYGYARGFAVAAGGAGLLPDGDTDGGGTLPSPFQVLDVDDGSNDRIYTMVPADHDGDGLSDVWLCRGDGFKSGHWVLGLVTQPSSETPSKGYEFHDTQVGCSVHDEVSVLALHGGARQSLLVVPAYETDPAALPHPADFDSPAAYEADYLPAAETDKTHYLEVQFTPDAGPGQLVPTSLPRDRYQRWHDSGCRNGVAAGLHGYPVYGAGLGSDKHVDVNGDGFTDVLRVELASGDGADNSDAILAGLGDADSDAGETDWSEALLCDPTAATAEPAGIRVYLNTGERFVQGPLVHEFTGDAHASYRVNFAGAQLYDKNRDGFVDVLLPSAGNGSGWSALLSDGDATFTLDDDVAIPDGWAAYDGTGDPQAALEQARNGRVLAVRPNHFSPAQLVFIGNPFGGDEDGLPSMHPDWPWWVNQFTSQDSVGQSGVRLEEITDGLGAGTVFTYRMVNPNDGRQTVGGPASVAAPPLRVVDTHAVQVAEDAGPHLPDPVADGYLKTRYTFSRGVQDRFGRGFVGFERVEVEHPGATASAAGVPPMTSLRFDLSRDEALGDYPYAGRPTQEQLVARWHPDGDRLLLACTETTWTLATEPHDGGSTWFSYAGERRTHDHFDHDGDGEHCGQHVSSDGTVFGAFRETVATEVRDTLGTVVQATHRVVGGDVATTAVPDVLNDTDAWIVGRPQRVQVETCVGAGQDGGAAADAACQGRERTVEVDPDTGVVRQVVIEPDSSLLSLTTAYDYDESGNLVRVDVSDETGATRTTTAAWDGGGVAPASVRDPAGHTAHFVHDPASGTLLAVVDPNGVTAVTAYDGFFRPVRQERRSSPLGATDNAEIEIEYLAGDPDEPGSAMRTRQRRLSHGQVLTADYDTVGRLRRNTWLGMATIGADQPDFGAGDEVYQRYRYDERGRPAETSVPAFTGQDPAGWTRYVYDDLDRTLEVVAPDDTTDTYAYGPDASVPTVGFTVAVPAGLPTRHVDAEGHPTWTVTDHNGRVVRTRDAAGTSTCFLWGPFDALAEVHRNCGTETAEEDVAGGRPITAYTYDGLGRMLTETDATYGTREYTYTAFGDLAQTRDAKDQVFDHAYDPLGRLTERAGPDGTSTYTWDTAHIGALTTTSTPGAHRAYAYDAFGRLASDTVTTAADPALGTTKRSFTFDYTYHSGDRLETLTYPTPDLPGQAPVTVRFEYDAAGYQRAVVDADDPTNRHWISLTGNAAGQVTQERFGNGVTTERSFDPLRHRADAILTTGGDNQPLQDLHMTWTDAGDLRSRTDGMHDQEETFTYDELHRLRTATIATTGPAGSTLETRYDRLGNIMFRSDVGAYHYDPAGRVTSHGHDGTGMIQLHHDANGNVDARGTQTLSYTADDKLSTLEDTGRQLTFRYDADGTRVLRHESGPDPADASATYTIGALYEREVAAPPGSGDVPGGSAPTGEQHLRYRIPAGDGRIIAQLTFDGAGHPLTAWSDTLTYLHDDHLGSAQVVSDDTGAAAQTLAHDPWGRARDGQQWTGPVPDADLTGLAAGFTGHPARLDGGLINMGGRMYDPALGRFTSPDPVLADPLDAQAYNRYSYVLNRPLVFTDPTGYTPEGPGTDVSGGGGGGGCGDPGFDYDYCNEGGPVRVVVVHTDGGSLNGHGVGPVASGYGPVGGYWGGSSHGSRHDRSPAHLRAGDARMTTGLLTEDEYIAIFGAPSARQRNPFQTLINLNNAFQSAAQTGLEATAMVNPIAAAIVAGVELTNAGVHGDPVDIALAVGSVALELAPGPNPRGAPRSIGRAPCSFDGDTRVVMAGGSTKAISQVEVGDWVLAEDPLSGERGVRQVTHLSVHTDSVADLYIDGHGVTTTEDHPFWNHTDEEWQAAETLDSGDSVLTAEGDLIAVGGLDGGSARTATAYNLTVDDLHTYYVVVGDHQVLVHNSCPLPSRIGQDARLVREAERAGQANQMSLDALQSQLAAGNRNPGIGTKHLFGDIFEARARDGARVYFRQSGEALEVVGKSNKANQSRVISLLEGLYGR